MSDGPHYDGLIIAGVENINIVTSPSTDIATLVNPSRVGKGDWAITYGPATVADTLYFRTTLAQMLRLGEKYEQANLTEPTSANQTKGIAIVDFFAIYNVGVVAATTLTLRLGKTVYTAAAGGGAPTQTDLVAATAITKTVTAAGYIESDVAYQTANQAGASLVFSTDDLGLVEIELAAVLASTGTFALAALGCHVDFNYC